MGSFHLLQTRSHIIIICKFHNNKLIQAGGWLRRWLNWLPAQSRAITKCRLDGSRLCPGKPCKTARIELSHVWQASPTPNCPQWEKCFLIGSLKLPCSNLCAWPLIVLPSTYVSGFLFISLLILEVMLLLGCLQSLFSKFEKPRFLGLTGHIFLPPTSYFRGLPSHAPFKFISQGFQNSRVCLLESILWLLRKGG